MICGNNHAPSPTPLRARGVVVVPPRQGTARSLRGTPPSQQKITSLLPGMTPASLRATPPLCGAAHSLRELTRRLFKAVARSHPAAATHGEIKRDFPESILIPVVFAPNHQFNPIFVAGFIESSAKDYARQLNPCTNYLQANEDAAALGPTRNTCPALQKSSDAESPGAFKSIQLQPQAEGGPARCRRIPLGGKCGSGHQ